MTWKALESGGCRVLRVLLEQWEQAGRDIYSLTIYILTKSDIDNLN